MSGDARVTHDDGLRCMGCGGDYASLMALSLNLPREQWLLVNPEDGGLLCANCMVGRAGKLPGAICLVARVVFADDYGPAEAQGGS